MSYVDEVYENVVAKNPNEPEFHQAVKEVLDSLRPVIDANEEKYRKEALLERIVEPERVIMFFPVLSDFLEKSPVLSSEFSIFVSTG